RVLGGGWAAALTGGSGGAGGLGGSVRGCAAVREVRGVGGDEGLEVVDGERLPACTGVDACAGECGLGGGGGAGPARQGGPQGLAALGEGRVDGGEHRLPVARARCVAPDDAHETGAHVGSGPEDVLADVRGAGDLAVPLALDAGHAVGAGAGRGGQAVGDLGLHHDEDLPDRREGREEVQQDGDGDVVREVRDERGGLAQVLRQPGHPHRVRVDQGERLRLAALRCAGEDLRGELVDRVREAGGQELIDLHGDD